MEHRGRTSRRCRERSIASRLRGTTGGPRPLAQCNVLCFLRPTDCPFRAVPAAHTWSAQSAPLLMQWVIPQSCPQLLSVNFCIFNKNFYYEKLFNNTFFLHKMIKHLRARFIRVWLLQFFAEIEYEKIHGT